MNIQVVSLKEKKNTPIYEQFFTWITELTPGLDDEDGKDFTDFIKRNLLLPDPYRVFVMFDKDLSEVIGVASLIPDDKNVGMELGIEGMWLGGVNIRRKFRGCGYGTALVSEVDKYVTNLERPQRVNLFTTNPIAVKIYQKMGFQDVGLNVTREKRQNTVYSKFYL